MSSLTSKLRFIQRLSVDNSPVILTAIGVAGVITTAVLTAKAVRRADHKVRIEEDRRVVDEGDSRGEFSLSSREVLELTWASYIPPVVSGVTTITCIVLANQIGNKRAAALAAAVTISERAFTDYRDKVVDILGESEDQRVRDAIAQDRINAHPPEQSNLILIGTNEVQCYDSYSGRYFLSTVETIRRAANDINEQIIHDEAASLSDFYRALGVPITSMSDEVGWTLDKTLDVRFGSMLAPDNTPCVSMDFTVLPIRNYWRND